MLVIWAGDCSKHILKILHIAYIWEEEYSSIHDIRAGHLRKRRIERSFKVRI